MKSKDGWRFRYPVPETPAPEGRRYVCVPVPDDQMHRLAFINQLRQLSKWTAWDYDEAHSAITCAAVWEEITQDVRQQLNENEGCGVNFDVRANPEVPCHLEKTTDGVTWEQWADVSNCGAVGPQGPQGATGPVGPIGPVGPAGSSGAGVAAPVPDLSPFSDRRCTMSTFVREELESMVDNFLGLVDSSSEMLGAVTSIVGAFIELGPLVDVIAQAIQLSTDIGTTVIRSGLSLQVWDNVQCDLHCNLDDVQPYLSTSVINLWSLDVDARDTLGVYSFLALFIRSFSQSGWNYISWRATLSDGFTGCAFCGCDTAQFDVSVRNGNVLSRTYPDNDTVTIVIEEITTGPNNQGGLDFDSGDPSSECPNHPFAMMEVTAFERLSGTQTGLGWGRIGGNCAFDATSLVVGGKGRVVSHRSSAAGDVWSFTMTRNLTT